MHNCTSTPSHLSLIASGVGYMRASMQDICRQRSNEGVEANEVESTQTVDTTPSRPHPSTTLTAIMGTSGESTPRTSASITTSTTRAYVDGKNERDNKGAVDLPQRDAPSYSVSESEGGIPRGPPYHTKTRLQATEASLTAVSPTKTNNTYSNKQASSIEAVDTNSNFLQQSIDREQTEKYFSSAATIHCFPWLSVMFALGIMCTLLTGS